MTPRETLQRAVGRLGTVQYVSYFNTAYYPGWYLADVRHRGRMLMDNERYMGRTFADAMRWARRRTKG